MAFHPLAALHGHRQQWRLASYVWTVSNGTANIDSHQRLSIMGSMGRATQVVCRIGRALAALLCGVLAGATLAVLIVEGRFSAFADMISRIGWIIRGRPGDDDTWMLGIEMNIAFRTALLIALAGSVLWGIVTWRNRQSYTAAALIGLILSLVMAAALLSSETTRITILDKPRHVGPLLYVTSLGCAGAVAGLVTYAVGKRRTKPTRNG